MVAERACEAPVAIDGRSGAKALAERVTTEDGEAMVSLVGAQDAVSACAGLLDAIRERAVTWYRPEGAGDVDDALTGSVITITRRPIGTGGGFGFGGADPTPAEAAALALWASRNLAQGGEMEVFF